MPETERRYQEIYDWITDTETEGRSQMADGKRKMAQAKIYGIVIGIAVGLIPVISSIGFDSSHLRSVAVISGATIAIIIGAFAYHTVHTKGSHMYNAGMEIVLEAQRTLVLVDTEYNTRQIAELLRNAGQPLNRP